jgi:hypothetical protein
MRSSTLPVALALIGLVSAHPGHDVSEELMERRAFKNAVRQSSLSHCAEKLKARGVEARNVQRRTALVDEVRALRGIFKRDADDVLGQSHNETDLGYTENTPISDLFSSNASCVLTPEVTQGPYCMSNTMSVHSLPIVANNASG